MVFKASNFCNIFDSEILDSEFNLKKNFKNSSIRKKRDRFGGLNLISLINKTCFPEVCSQTGTRRTTVPARVHEFGLREKILKIIF